MDTRLSIGKHTPLQPTTAQAGQPFSVKLENQDKDTLIIFSTSDLVRQRDNMPESIISRLTYKEMLLDLLQDKYQSVKLRIIFVPQKARKTLIRKLVLEFISKAYSGNSVIQPRIYSLPRGSKQMIWDIDYSMSLNGLKEIQLHNPLKGTYHMHLYFKKV